MSLAAGGPGVVHADCPYGSASCTPKHGMCGDVYNQPQDHVEGGKFSSGLVNGVYSVGQTIYFTMVITAHHYGFHQFTLYDLPDTATATTKTTTAVPSYVLKLANPEPTHNKCRYWDIDPNTDWCMPGGPASNDQTYYMEYKLPAGVDCKR